MIFCLFLIENYTFTNGFVVVWLFTLYIYFIISQLGNYNEMPKKFIHTQMAIILIIHLHTYHMYTNNNNYCIRWCMCYYLITQSILFHIYIHSFYNYHNQSNPIAFIFKQIYFYVYIIIYRFSLMIDVY